MTEEQQQAVLELLRVARQYLIFPEVAAIGFALSSTVVAKRIDRLLAKVNDNNKEDI